MLYLDIDLALSCMLQVCMLSLSIMSDSLQCLGLLALQAPLSMGFSRQEYWSALLCPPPGHLPDAGIEHATLTFNLHWQADTLLNTWEAHPI